MKVPVSWLREFAAVAGDPQAIARRLADCGFATEQIDGETIDFEVTANRPDCLSVYGFAREAAVAFGAPLAARPGTDPIAESSAEGPIGVTIEDAACGRYALAIADVVVAPSPDWMTARLLAAGVRPINNVVDVTNYVMLEMGQPMHAFDAATLGGSAIRVRRATVGERLTTLDGQARSLDPSMLVIADATRAVAVAGVMGGFATEVSSATRRIAIESAWFAPGSVRATSKRLGLKTEASIRFERGADLDAPVLALRRALALIEKIGAGRVTAATRDVYPSPRAPRVVPLAPSRIRRLLGDVVPAADVERILTGLGFAIDRAADGWRVTVPSFRVDVARQADLIEEVGRHWGFNRIPATFPPMTQPPRPPGGDVLAERLARRMLCGAGLQEAVTFTFIESAAAAPFARDAAGLVAIANPLSEKFGVLRPSLLPGLLDALVYNRRREAASVQLFEIGTVFAPAGERTHAGWVLTGPRLEHWGAPAAEVDFFDAKGIAELAGAAFGIAVSAEAASDLPWFTPGRAARLVTAGGEPIGEAGEIRPAIAAARGLTSKSAVVAGWVALDALRGATASAGSARSTMRPIDPLPTQPSVVRDLSIVVDERLPAADVRGTIRAHAPATLVAVREFDRYQGRGVPEGRVSLSIRLTFRDAARTLTDAEVHAAVDAIVAALARDHGAVLRGEAPQR
jgi:phenylalanyl-tRNA synthetase beta chain